MNYRDCFTQSNHTSTYDKDDSNGVHNKSVSVKISLDKDTVQPNNLRLKDELPVDRTDVNRPCMQNVSFKSNLPDLISFDNINLLDKSLTSLDSNDNSKHETLDVENVGKRNNNISIPQTFVPSTNPINSISKSLIINNNDCTSLSDINQMSHDRHRRDEVQYFESNEPVDSNKKIMSSSGQLSSSTTEELNAVVDLQENYVFEAGYLLSLGAKNEGKADYQAAFDSYKFGIEKLLIGVHGIFLI